MNFDSGTDTDFISLFGTATSSFDLATTAIANVEKLKFTGGTHTATLDHCKSVRARSTLWLLRRKPARI